MPQCRGTTVHDGLSAQSKSCLTEDFNVDENGNETVNEEAVLTASLRPLVSDLRYFEHQANYLASNMLQYKCKTDLKIVSAIEAVSIEVQMCTVKLVKLKREMSKLQQEFNRFKLTMIQPSHTKIYFIAAKKCVHILKSDKYQGN